MQDKNKSSYCQVGYFDNFRGFYLISHKGHCDALPSPGGTHLRVHQNVIAESWDLEGAPDF
jgi:hypothetical protein